MVQKWNYEQKNKVRKRNKLLHELFRPHPAHWFLANRKFLKNKSLTGFILTG